jgi:16S rRNA C967 or C1407 C5-methylase (RsmB/RsmF family)
MTYMGKLPYGMERADDPNDEGRVLRNQLRILEEQQLRLADAMKKDPMNLDWVHQQMKLTNAISGITRMMLAQAKAQQERVEVLSWEEKRDLVVETLKEAPPEIKLEVSKHLARSAAATRRESDKDANGTHAGRFAPGPDVRRSDEGGISTGPGSKGGVSGS